MEGKELEVLCEFHCMLASTEWQGGIGQVWTIKSKINLKRVERQGRRQPG